MWPGPEGGGLEGGGNPDPHTYSLSLPEGGSMDASDTTQHLKGFSGERVQKLNPEDHPKQAQPQGTKSRLALLQSRAKSKRESALIRPDDKSRKLDHADTSKQPEGRSAAPVDKKRQLNKANKGKVNMVREQLEQNRLRFERRGQVLNETAKTMEVKLEHLRQQLEERDMSIQQLQSGELPAVEIQPPGVDLKELLKERDAKLAELSQKVASLENTILDMQENLKEKDAVIEARTQAITLLSEDLSKKRKTTVDTLEETRQQMKIMQENFVGIEAGLTAEIEQLSQTLETKNQKLQQMEFHLAQAEQVRVELMVRNAELEEKLTLASSQPGDNVQELKSKIEEFTNLLDEANKKGIALQAEKKALNKQLKSLRKGADANEEIVKLQNHVAELEEEKASESAWQKRVEELEVKMKQQAEDLENHVHMITMLESDKLEVLSNLAEQSRELDDLKNYVSELEKGKSPRAVDLDEQWNVVSGPKSEDSTLLQELCGTSERLAESEKTIAEQDALIQELKSKLLQMECDRNDQQLFVSSLAAKDPADQESILTEMKLQLKESVGALEEWRAKSERVEAELESVSLELRMKEKEFAALEEKLANNEQALTLRVEDAEKDLQSRRIQVQELQNLISELAVRFDRVEEISVGKAQVQEVTEVSEAVAVVELHAPTGKAPQQDEIVLQQTAESLKLSLEESNRKVMTLERNLKDKTDLVAELEAQLQTCSTNQDEQKAKIDMLKSQLSGEGSSQDEVIALKGALELRNDECQRLEAKIRTQTEKLKKAVVNLKAKTVANNDLTDKVTKLQTAMESNQALVDNLAKDKNEILEKWQTESSEKVELLSVLADVKRTLAEKEREIAELSKEIDTKEYLLEETKAHLDNKIVEMVELEASLAQKDSQLAALKDRVAVPADHEDGAGDAAAKDAQITKLQNVAKSYKAKLVKEKKAHTEVEEKLTALEQTLAEKTAQLEEAFEKLNQQNLAYEAKVLEYEAYVDSLKQELDRERHQLCHLSESLADTEHRCKNLENDYQKLEQQMSEAHQQGASELANELDRRRHEAEDRERSMVRELHNLRDENKELSQNVGEAEGRIKALQMELATVIAKMTEMSQEWERRAGWEEQANSAANDVLTLEAKIKNMVREHKQQLEDQVAETNQLRESLQNELDDGREHVNKLEVEMNLLREQMGITTRAEQELAQDIQQKESELEEMRQIMAALEDQRKQQLAEMTADLDSFKLRVMELESGSAASRADSDDAASARISELNTTVKALTGEIEMMKAQAKKSESHDVIDERPSIPQELDTHVTAYQLMSSLNSMVLELEAELNQVWSERDMALAQIDQLMNNSLPRDESLVAYNMDESLMEKNMNKLESELSGMVTSQQEGTQSGGSASCEGPPETSWSMVPTGRSDEDVWKWDAARPETAEHLKEKFSVLEQRIKKKLTRMSLHLKQGKDDSAVTHTAAEDRYQKLTGQIKELETERNDALSQMKLLRAEVDKLTSGMEKGLPLGEASVAPTPTIESAPGWDMDDPDAWGWGDKTQDELQNKISALESERAKLAEDLKAAQVRSVKLAKKMKEMKQKYETSKVSSSCGLDQALEDEFAQQVSKLEKDLSESVAELTSVRSERDNLAKQVQVLSNANERFVDMKERQDFEVEMWQKRSDDLQKKINALEWEIDELKNEKSESGEKPFAETATECLKCVELEKQLTLLSEESEALQAVLIKHKENEVTPSVDPLMTETLSWSSHQQEGPPCASNTEKSATMEPVVAELTAAVERLENEKKYLQDVHDSLKLEWESVSAQLNQTQEVLIRERNTREGELSTRHMEETLLREKYQEVLSENEDIRDRCRKLEEEMKETTEASHSGNEVEQLKHHLSVQATNLAARDRSIENLEAQVEDLRGQLQSAVNDVNSMQSERTRIMDQLTALSAATNELQGKLEAEIAQLKYQLSEQSNIVASKEQTIERLEAELLNARMQLKSSADEASAVEIEAPKAIAITQPEVRSAADWFSSQSQPIEQSLDIGTPPTSVFNWDAMTSGGHAQLDVFDTIQKTSISQTTQAPAAPTSVVPTVAGVSTAELEAKEAELEKMTRFVETLKLTTSEAELEWNHAMEYTKSQLQTALDELERIKLVLSARERELCECREAFERSSQEYQQELANRDRELKSEKSQIEALRADLSEKERRLGTLQEGELSELQLQLAEKDQLLLQVQSKRDHDLSEANQQIADLKTKLSQKEWQMTEITMAREKELAMRDEVKGKELKEQIAEKDLQLSEERHRLEEQIEALQMTADQQAATIAQLQTKLAADAPALEEMRLYAEEQARIVVDLRNQVQVINQELNDTRQYSREQASTLNSLQHQLQSNEEELGRLRYSQQKMVELEQELEQLREKVVHREKTIERLQAGIELMEQEKSAMKTYDDFSQLEANLVSKENDLLLLRQELSLKEELVTKLQAVAQTKDTEIQELQDKIQRLEMKRMWDAEVKANREAAAKLEQTAQAGGDKGIRSDLDQALNILHQRDVRCEELTLELMRLLEERDSLQLRLSSALRHNEDLRAKLKQVDMSPNVSGQAPAANQGLQELAPTFGADGANAAYAAADDASVDADGNMQGLANKLAELKRVGYSRDVRIKDESELRHKEQMRLITSSPSTFSPPPLTIVPSSTLVPSLADFTTVEGTGASVDLVASNSEAQDEQSSSLFDWFLGRSPRQIMDI